MQITHVLFLLTYLKYIVKYLMLLPLTNTYTFYSSIITQALHTFFFLFFNKSTFNRNLKSEEKNCNVRSKSHLQCSLLQVIMKRNTSWSSKKGSLKVFTFHYSICFNFPIWCMSNNFKPFYLFSEYFILQWYKQTLKELWKK